MSFEATIKGWTGELKTKITQTLFLDLKEYHIYNNVLLNASHGTTQIDHIIVSKYGIFVVETKNKSGLIYGKSNAPFWTQEFYNTKYKFQNPLRQNYLHEKSVAEYFKVSRNLIFPIIVFWGNCKFKTTMPENVLNHNYISYIKSKKLVLLHDHEVERICQELNRIKANASFLDGWRHKKALERRYHKA
jgi:restriction system protein